MSYRLGLLMQLTDQTRAGITWNSETNYRYSVNGKARVQNGAYDLPVSAQISAPQQIMLSLVHDINPRWSVMGDLGWQDWSQFGAPQIVVGDRQLNNVSRLKDTWHGAVGVQYRPTPQWRLNIGVAFDSSPYESQSDVALTLPTGDEWRFGTGPVSDHPGQQYWYCRVVSSYAVVACEIPDGVCRKLRSSLSLVCQRQLQLSVLIG